MLFQISLIHGKILSGKIVPTRGIYFNETVVYLIEYMRLMRFGIYDVLR
jgi:hypothetical protein